MIKRIALCAVALMCVTGVAQAQNRLQGELELKAASKIERDAGVWLNGQYVGFVDDLRGSDRLVLVPGQHQLLFKLIGYQDLETSITIEPSQEAEFRVSMAPEPGTVYPTRENTARLRIEVEPADAAIFVDDQFVGHVDRFDGRSGMRIAPGTYRFTIALPGYEAFETEMTLRESQTYEIKTSLGRGNLSDQAAELIAANAGVSEADD